MFSKLLNIFKTKMKLGLVMFTLSDKKKNYWEQ